MARNRIETIQAIGDWKRIISNVENVPLNPNHKYKDENDMYERLTEYVKDWVEGMFGYYTNENGELQKLVESENPLENEVSQEAKEWLQGVNGKISPLQNDWFKVALNGQKPGNFALPTIDESKNNTEEEKENTRKDIRYEVDSAFFPAYRALRDSFDKRWWFEWIFNHAQYVAERDALKVMTNVITSMTGFTKEELNTEYLKNKASISNEDIVNAQNAENVQRDLQVDAVTELFADEKRIDNYIDLKSGRVEIEDEKSTVTELFKDVDRIDGSFEEYDGNSLSEEELIEENEDLDIESAEEWLDEFNYDDEIDNICAKFAKEVKNTDVKRSAIKKSMEQNVYKPLLQKAKFCCNFYDVYHNTCKNDPVKLNSGVQKTITSTAKTMFETAFKGLDATITINDDKISLFGIKSLKDQIISAQKITDIMLKERTPAGFEKENLDQYTKGYHILEKTDELRNFLKTNYSDKYSEKEIDSAIKGARKEFGVMYRGEKPDMSHIYNIGYRPNYKNLKEDGKAFTKIQPMVKEDATTKKREIEDEALRVILSENARRWKALNSAVKNNDRFNEKEAEAMWAERDKQLKTMYPNYDVENSERLINENIDRKNAQNNVQEKINVELDEQKGQIVPPVEAKPVQIEQIKIEK